MGGSVRRRINRLITFSFSCYNIIFRGIVFLSRAQLLMGRALGSRLREPGFELCAAVLKPWASLFTLHCSS